MTVSAICALGLTGCLASTDGDSVQRGFISSSAGSPFNLGSGGARKASLALGDVRVKAPKGYCVDADSTQIDSFLLLVDCGVLKQSTKSAPDSRGLITVSVSAPMPGGAEVKRTPASLGAVSQTMFSGRGVTLMRVTQGGDSLIPDASPIYWRALVAVNDRAVTLAAYGPPDGALAGDKGRQLLAELANNILKASPERRAQAAVTPIPSAPDVSTETVR